MAYPMCAEITKKERSIMKHVKTLNTKRLQNTKKAAAASARHPASLHAKHPVQ